MTGVATSQVALGSSGDFQAQSSRGRLPLRLLVGGMLASIVLLFAAAPKASAFDIGLMAGDNSWIEESGWETMDHSGATVFRKAISAFEWENAGMRENIKQMFRYAAERNILILPYLYGRPVSGSQQFPTAAEWSAIGGNWDNFVFSIVHTFGYNGSFWAENPSLPYRPVGTWEIWNEPNLPENNPGGASVQPKEYARFMWWTSERIKVAQGQISGVQPEVLFGGLYSRVGANAMSVGEFLQQAKEVETKEGLPIGPSFNGFSLHPYSFTEGLGGVQTYVNTARSKLTQYFGNKPLWITELGWNVSPAGQYTLPYGDVFHPAVNEGQQAQFLTESFNWIKAVAWEKNISTLFWYFLRDNAASPNWIGYTGLLRADGTIRPSWAAFQAQTGAPTWAPPPPSAEQWASWSAGYTVDHADVNGDGKADIVGRYGNDVQVALSDGTKFVPKGTWTSWSAAYTAPFDVADVNGDGKADIVGRYGSDVQVGLSDGTKFKSSSNWLGWSAGYTLELADVNGDSKADVVGRYGTDVQVALSTGTKFTGQGTWTSWSAGYTLDLADVNGDKKVDIVGRNGTNIQAALSTGGNFQTSATWLNDWTAVYSTKFADADGDGKADVIGRYGDYVEVFASSGPPPPNSKKWGSWSPGYTLDLADVNNDKKADIVGRYANDVQVALSDGTKFTAQGTWTGWSAGYTLELGDVNGDGKADIVGRYGNDVQVALSDGTKFVPKGTWTSWSAGYTLDLADVNGDGKADIVGRYGNDVQVALSDGSQFVPQGTWTSWSTGYTLELADINNDKKADIVGRNGTNIQVAYSTGSNFGTGVSWLNDWSIKYSAKFADVTGEGKADVIGRYGDYVAVFESL